MNVAERNYNLDYIKGVAILMVIVFHCLMSYSMKFGGIFYIEQAVPLFLIVSAYLVFEKLKLKTSSGYFDKKIFLKVVKRIFVPFIIFEIVIVLISLVKHNFSVFGFIISGGIGMGSYYPWLYLQYWLLLPFLFSLLIKFNKWGGVILIFGTIICSVLFYSIVYLIGHRSIVDAVWRLFIGKYIFTAYIAWLLLEIFFKLKYYFPLIIMGIAYMFMHRYKIVNLQPWFYTTEAFPWNGVNFPTYYYSGLLFFVMYKLLPKFNTGIKKILQFLGQNSWEIFLGQMLFFAILPPRNSPIMALLTIPLAIGFSMIAAYLYILCTEKWSISFRKNRL